MCGRCTGPDGPIDDTFVVVWTVLVVIRTVTTLDRLFDVLPALVDPRVSIRFVIDEGSRFANGLVEILRACGMKVISWEEAKAGDWDLIIAAHANQNLAELRGPRVSVPHGAGLCRIVPASTGSTEAPVGIAPGQIVTAGAVIPTAIGLSHESQLTQLTNYCPEATDRAFMMGDPTFDRIIANKRRRDGFRARLGVGNRRVVVVSSTWGRFSSVGRAKELAHRLVAQLPVDEWLVILVLHPNIWFGERSPWEIVNSHFVDALDSGVLIMKPDNGWQTASLAADVMVGDHGSVSFYGAALGTPFLLSSTGLEELDPSSPRVLLSREAPLLDIDGDLLAQLESTMAGYDPAPIMRITDQTLGMQGRSLQLLRARFYELLGGSPPPRDCRIRDLPEPDFYQCARPPSAHLMLAEVADDGRTSATVRLGRFPAMVSDHRPAAPPVDLPLVVLHTEVDVRQLESAEIIVHEGTVQPDVVEHRLIELGRSYPGCALVAVSDGTRCCLRWRDGRAFHATVEGRTGAELDVSDTYVAAMALYAWAVNRGELPRSDVTIRAVLGSTEIEIRMCSVAAGDD